jgi:hypothetical protein
MEFKMDNVVAVKVLNKDDVEVRYGDGTPPVVLKDTTTSAVMRKITDHKAKKLGTDSA